MERIEIKGGVALGGEVKIQGSKNAALPILAGTVLNRGLSILHNCPQIRDVFYMVQILENIGCKVVWEGSTVIVDATLLNTPVITQEYAKMMRSSITILGSMLGRMKQVEIAYPGGCTIGKRPIDLHISSLRKMGVLIEEKEEYLCGWTNALKGCEITLDFPSVGATENIILAAVLAEGTTRIHGPAREPEIIELCAFLNQAGARIWGEGTDCIVIEGVAALHEVEYRISADRIVAGTYCLGILASQGEGILNNAPVGQMGALLNLIQQMGASYQAEENRLYVKASKEIKGGLTVTTCPYPGFPTDLQAPLMAVLMKAPGDSVIQEEIFESRFQVVEEFQKMGAHISIEGTKAIITGNQCLHGAQVRASELRGGAALVIAGLMAEGETIVSQAGFIERGYENICRDLTYLGAKLSCY